MSNVSRGNYYVKKTREFYEKDGYKVEKLETLSSYFFKGRVRWVKKDMLFSDLLAYSKNEFILIQVKGGASFRPSSSEVKKSIKNYQSLEVPKYIKKLIVIWEPRVKKPTLLEIK